MQHDQIFVIRLSQTQILFIYWRQNNLMLFKWHNQSLLFKILLKPLKLEGFCDSDWDNLSDRKSVSRFYFRFAENNPMISWKSKKQNSVALSTFKAEFIAISLASQEALYLRALLRTMMELESLKTQQLFIVIISPVLFWQKPIHQRSKHIDIKFQFIHDEIKDRFL